VSILALVGVTLAACARRHPPSATSAPIAVHVDLPILWEVPPFAFADANGHATTASALRGHVWIADLIFTRCVTMCPIITSRMNLLRRSIRSGDIRFVSFSIDPEHDTPAVLRDYAARWDADPRWLLLSPPPGKQMEFAQAMQAPFEHTEMPREPILHTTQFYLIDQLGRVRGLYSSLDDAAVRRLAADATLLDGSAGTPPGGEPTASAGAPRGRALFQSLGCAACHADPKTGPPLAGLAGRTVHLEGGAAVLADPAYLRQSILAPGEKVVLGYGHLMPAYAGYLAPAEVDDLVAYLQGI
jgi:protein SCO1/2